MILATALFASIVGITPSPVTITPCGPPSYLTPRTEAELYQLFGPMYARHTMPATSPSGERGTQTLLKLDGVDAVLFNRDGEEPRVVRLRVHRHHPNVWVASNGYGDGERTYQCSGGTTLTVRHHGAKREIDWQNWGQ